MHCYSVHQQLFLLHVMITLFSPYSVETLVGQIMTTNFPLFGETDGCIDDYLAANGRCMSLPRFSP